MRTGLATADLPKLTPATWALLVLCLSWLPERASAHPAAAESPTFLDAPCVVVVDKREQAYLDIAYSVLSDDTSIGAGDIPVSDAKTHQFFAITGNLYGVGIDDIYVPFMDPAAQGGVFPLWITPSDLQRAAAAVELASGVSADQTELPPAGVLETRTDLAGNWLRITGDDQRRPITSTQAFLPARWQLAAVPAGVYTVAGYVFSPPYNAWAPRKGVVKIVDAEHNPAAGALLPVKEVAFAYQGLRVRGCVDVPKSTLLDAYYFAKDKPELGWVPWLHDKPIETGDQELCFHLDRADVVGEIRVRWDLRPASGGPVTTLRTQDMFTWLPGTGECQTSDTHCCDFAADAAYAGAADAGSHVESPGTAAGSGGCAILVGVGVAPGQAFAWIAVACALLRAGRRARPLDQ